MEKGGFNQVTSALIFMDMRRAKPAEDRSYLLLWTTGTELETKLGGWALPGNHIVRRKREGRLWKGWAVGYVCVCWWNKKPQASWWLWGMGGVGFQLHRAWSGAFLPIAVSCGQFGWGFHKPDPWLPTHLWVVLYMEGHPADFCCRLDGPSSPRVHSKPLPPKPFGGVGVWKDHNSDS